MARVRAGDDRRVVRERDGRQRRHRAVPERDAHLDEPGDVRRLAAWRPCRRARWRWCRRTGSRRRGAAARPARARSVSAATVLHARGSRPSSSASGAQPSSAQIVGATSTSRAARGTRPSLRTPLPREHERRPRLHEAERAVLAEVAALVLPVVRGGVEHAQVGRGRRVEELGDLVERVRVGVLACGAGTAWARSSARGVNLSVDWSASGSRPVDRDALVGAVGGAAEGDPAVVRERLVGAVAGGAAPCRRSARARCRGAPRGPPRPRSRWASGTWWGGAVGRRIVMAAEGYARLSESGQDGYCLGFGAAVSRAPARSQNERVLPVRTFTPKAADITREWHVIDAEGAILGRLATEIATLLRGKHKPIWVAAHRHRRPRRDRERVEARGRPAQARCRRRTTATRGYPGGIRSESLEHLLGPRPREGRASSRCGACCRRARSAARC